jgi:hypothetical protein
VESKNESGCIVVDYSNQATIPGELIGSQEKNFAAFLNSGESSYKDRGAISLTNQDIVYRKLTENTPFNFNKTYQAIHWRGKPSFDGIIFEKKDSTNSIANISVGFSFDRFYYKFGNNERKEVICDYYTVKDGATEPVMVPANINSDNYASDKYPANGVLYGLSENVELNEDDMLVSNDPINKFWWFIFIGDKDVIFVRDEVSRIVQ